MLMFNLLKLVLSLLKAAVCFADSLWMVGVASVLFRLQELFFLVAFDCVDIQPIYEVVWAK